MTEHLGRYDILEEIGQGGFAIVYRARDTELDRLVALKELKKILLQDDNWIRRFRREARAIARLDHPRIVTVYDITEVEDRLFIVMRLVDGPSLEGLIASRGQLGWTEAVEITTALAEGLDYAHGQGVLHRDLKPANILIDPERGPQLTDFGLAKLVGESSMSFSASGSVVGTPHYIAPEVWEGQRATAQTDVYAFGCILFEMLTGEKIFKGETPPAVMMAHFKPLALPQTWSEDVPAGIAEILKTALAAQPVNRYATASKLAEALVALSGSTPVDPRSVTVGTEQFGPEDQPELVGAVTGEPEPDSSKVEESSAARSTAPAADQPKTPEETTPQPETALPERSVAAPPPPAASSRVRTGRKERKGAGCKWLTALVIIGVVLVVGIGLGGLCSTVGGIFTVGSLFNSLPTVEVGPTQDKEILVLPPASSGPVRLDLKFDSGDLFLAPGAETGLIEGTATYNVVQLEPRVITSSNMVRLEHETALGLANITAPNAVNTWDLKLGSTPMELEIEAGLIKKGRLELGGLPLHNLTINPGAGELIVLFSAVNPVEMDTLEFKSHAAKADLIGLANAHTQEINLESTAGEFKLDFSGELQGDLAVKVTATSLSQVTVIVPEDTAAQIAINGQGTTITREGSWREFGGDYLNSGTGYEISIDVDIGAGTLNLRNR